MRCGYSVGVQKRRPKQVKKLKLHWQSRLFSGFPLSQIDILVNLTLGNCASRLSNACGRNIDVDGLNCRICECSLVHERQYIYKLKKKEKNVWNSGRNNNIFKMLSQITCCLHMLACHAYVFITGRIASCQRSGPTSLSSLTLTEKSLFTYDQNVAKLLSQNGYWHVHTEKKVHLSIDSTIHMVQHEVSGAGWLLPLLNSVSSISVSKFWPWSAPACFTKMGIYCC